jgi:hypothetical protein
MRRSAHPKVALSRRHRNAGFLPLSYRLISYRLISYRLISYRLIRAEF